MRLWKSVFFPTPWLFTQFFPRPGTLSARPRPGAARFLGRVRSAAFNTAGQSARGPPTPPTQTSNAPHLARVPHPYPPPAIQFLQQTVHPFARAAFFEPLRLRRRKRNLFAAARVGVNDRHMAQSAAEGVDLRRVIGAVHQVVERGHPPGGQLRQGNHHLRIMHAGAGQDRADREIPIRLPLLGSAAFQETGGGDGVWPAFARVTEKLAVETTALPGGRFAVSGFKAQTCVRGIRSGGTVSPARRRARFLPRCHPPVPDLTCRRV